MAKVVFTEGVKQGSERLTQPNHSSLNGTDSDLLSQNPVMTKCDNGLQQNHLLRSETSTGKAPQTVSHAAPAQQAANLPVYSTQYGVMDSNKTF